MISVLARICTEDVSDAVATVAEKYNDSYDAVAVPVEDDAVIVDAVAVPVQEDNCFSSSTRPGEAYVKDTVRNVILLDTCFMI